MRHGSVPLTRGVLPFSLPAEVSFMTGKYMAAATALVLVFVSVGLAKLRPESNADWTAPEQQMQMDMSGQDLGIPSYHAYALKPPFPATLDPNRFPDALNRNVYALAAKVRPVLYQQPCYCYCDRHAGHKACSTASSARTDRNAMCARRKQCSPTSSLARAKRPRRFAPQSSTAIGARWT